MKKFLALALALAMALSLAACGGKENPKPAGNASNNGTPPATSQQTEQPESTPDDSKSSGGAVDYSQFFEDDGIFPILDRYDVFPSADYWTALGLPDNFSIEIIEMDFSDTDSIYPQDFEEGNMFECTVDDNKAAYTTLADSLWSAGINGFPADGGVTPAADRAEIDQYDVDAHVYQAFWQLNGELMSIELRARDNSEKISVTVKYLPTDAE